VEDQTLILSGIHIELANSMPGHILVRSFSIEKRERMRVRAERFSSVPGGENECYLCESEHHSIMVI